MTRQTSILVAALAAAALVVAACGDDDDSDGTESSAETEATGTEASAATVATEGSAETTAATEDTGEPTATTTEGTEGEEAGAAWTVSTEDCVDPDRPNEPIEGEVFIGSAMPLSGGPAASAFQPVAQGFEAYINYANEQGLLADHEIVLEIGDDQFDPASTPNVVNGLLDEGAHILSGIIGTPNNLSVRDTLNEECIPQLLASSGSPVFADPANYPWTTSILTPYDLESQAYAENMAQEFPDASTVGLFYVSTEFGQVYADAFEALSDELGFEIVDEQTIEAAETAPPQAQVTSLASNAPDVIMAVPLGAQCPTFMTELANAKAANPGWEPIVYITSSCGSPLILGAAGAAADGLYTSASMGIQDIANPEVQAQPAIADYIAVMEEQGLGDIITTGAAGWNFGEVTVEILRQAAESPDGLTQASIMNVSRNLDFVPSLVREGVSYTTSGEEDATYSDDIQVIQYDAEAMHFTDIGEIISFGS